MSKPRLVHPPFEDDAPFDPEPGRPLRPCSEDYLRVRRRSVDLCSHLDPEDLVAQSMPDASPAKWHLAHTTWFFENFVLGPHQPGYEAHHPTYGFLFNSYYNGAGERHERPARGVLTRPRLSEVLAYREAIDDAVMAILDTEAHPKKDEVLRVVEIGMHHEQQHQELIITDLKHLFSQNALRPAYRDALPAYSGSAPSLGWTACEEGVREIGHMGTGFCFDNERPHHRVFVDGFELADRLISNGEYRQFMEDGGYERADLWLDRGWATAREHEWAHPLYWRRDGDGWSEFTLAGQRELCDDEPVCHVSFMEADAFARWAGARLPTEAEWEIVARDVSVEGNFVDSGRMHPQRAAPDGDGPRQLFGDTWEWTRSSYSPYPGYHPEDGTLGEYNGKFMCDQLVLRGGSCASPASHLRASYRNFFYPPDRWQLTGIRLAREQR